MKKNILFALVLMFIGVSAHAQWSSKPAISFGGDIVLPFHSSGNSVVGPESYYKTGAGFAIKAELPGSKQMAVTLSAGYLMYVPKPLYYLDMPANCPTCTVPTGPHSNPPYEYIPVKAGLRYYLGQFYLDGEAGAGIKVNYKAKTSFIYGGGLGWAIPFNAHDGLDIGAHFERGFKSFNYPLVFTQADLSLAYRRRF